MLKRQGAIEIWHDRRITAGKEFAGSIDNEIERADIILLLVSPDFLASDYCYDIEMTKAIERHHAGTAHVIPVILRPCDWRAAPFGKLLAAPRDGKPVTRWPDLDDAFLDVIHCIKEVLPKPEGRMTKASVNPPVIDVPRSSNLRLAKRFTDANKDRFLDEAFEYMSKFFENSLSELQSRNIGIETSFRKLDANRFTAVIYREGKAIARCKIALGGILGREIGFSYNDRIDDTSINDAISVETDDAGIHLKALGLGRMGSNGNSHLTFEGAAEYFWSLIIEPLQRSR